MGALQFVQRARLGEQRFRPLGCPGLLFGLGRGQRPPPRSAGSTVNAIARSRKAASTAIPPRRWPCPPTARAPRRPPRPAHGRLGSVPGAPIRINLRIRHLCHHAVSLPSVSAGATDRSPSAPADVVAHISVNVQEPIRFGRLRSLDADRRGPPRAPQQAASPVGSAATASNSSCASSGDAQSVAQSSPRFALIAAVSPATHSRLPAPRGQLTRQFQQCQRITPCLGH